MGGPHAPGGLEATMSRPVATVVVDNGLPHLDREFEYAVAPALDAVAVPGVRVRVRFAGRDLDGYVVERRERAEHPGSLTPIRRVVSPEPVLTAEVLATARACARWYAGTLGDVLRLAIPKRHAAAERALPMEPPAAHAAPPSPEPGPWAAYPAGPSFLRRIAAGEAPSAAWSALPCQPAQGDWPEALAVAAGTALAHDRGSLLVVPDHRDVDRVDAALTGLLGRGRHVRLTADQGPQARYTAWLKILRGHVRVVVGTRAAMFAPVSGLGLLAWWDDGDDLLLEPRAPYPHVREVLAIRAEQTGAALLSGGFARTVEVAQMVRAGRLADVRAPTAAVRAAAPRVLVAGEGGEHGRDGPAAAAHVPPAAWRAAKKGLDAGPVLVQVPRGGYLPALSCRSCRTPLSCPRCHGPVAVLAPGQPPRCRWCGEGFGHGEHVCPTCGAGSFRSAVVGARRTAEELGRAFPGVPVLTSGTGPVLPHVGAGPALVIATPGAEPLAEGGYAAALLLDAWATQQRSAVDASIEALRRWCAAGALVRPGGVLLVAGAGAHAGFTAIEALVRWDPTWLADRELDERRTLGLPPTVTMAQLIGPRRAVGQVVDTVSAQLPVQALGPLPLRQIEGEVEHVQVMLRAPAGQRDELAGVLAAARAQRSARKEPEQVSIRLDCAGTYR